MYVIITLSDHSCNVLIIINFHHLEKKSHFSFLMNQIYTSCKFFGELGTYGNVVLYHIIYRLHLYLFSGPPKKPELPKMIVETVRFNPSVCTCGEHGCEPRYRMEKRVLWTNKEICMEKQELASNERGKKDQVKDNDEEKVRVGDRNEDLKYGRVSREVIKTKRGISKECNDEEKGDGKNGCIDGGEYKVAKICESNNSTAGDGDKHGLDRSFKRCDRKVKCDIGSAVDKVGIKDASSHKNDCKRFLKDGRNERNELTDGIYDEDVSTYKEKQKGVGCNECDVTESRNTEETTIKEQGSGEKDRACDDIGNGYSIEKYSNNDRDEMTTNGSAADEENDGCNITEDESEEISSAFGIMSVYCNSQIHNWYVYLFCIVK